MAETAASSQFPGPPSGSLASRVWPAELAPGAATAVAEGVTRIVAPNPGMMTGPGTNTYLVGHDRLAVVDPGPDDDAHLDALCRAGAGRIGWILVTHSHVDHSPLAVRLAAATGAPVVGFGPAPRLAPVGGIDPHDATFDPQMVMADGDRLVLDGFALDAVHTPGHASNHLCFELVGTGLLFSGDHVMSGSTVVIAPPDGDMALYLDSLAKVGARTLRRIAPGHGDMIDDPYSVLDSYLRHRVERERQVLAALGSPSRWGGGSPEGHTVEMVVETVYVDVPAELHPVARFSVWAHLRKLAAERLVSSPDPDDITSPWSRNAPRKDAPEGI